MESPALNPQKSNIRAEETALKKAQQVCWGIIQKISEANDALEMSRQFANYFCRVLAVDQVAVILKQKRHLKTVAISGIDTIDRNSSTVKGLEQLCADDCEEFQFWSHRSQNFDESGTSRMLGQFAGSNGFQSAVLAPIEFRNVTKSRNNSNKSAAGRQSQRVVAGYVAIFADSPRMNQKHLELIHRELGPTFARNLHVSQILERKGIARFSPKANRRPFLSGKKLFLLGLLLLAGILALPRPYQIECDVVVEPMQRRFVASPMEGRLKESLVESGDKVRRSQVLAVLDGEEIELQLKTARAELLREQEKHDSALQMGKISEAQIAALEIKKLNHDIELYQKQVQRLEIRSPIDGIVVSGDLEKVVGAPLEIGQSLFEIGPIDKLLVEVMVPENQVRFVKPKQQVDIRFDSFPLEPFQGTIKKVYPRAEVRSSNAVFVAVVEIENRDRMLKPGMQGQAHILAGPSTIAWNLFHRPVDSFRSWIGY